MARQRSLVSDWENDDHNNLHGRMLKSGINKSYNDLVVREIIWPNDLILSGSEKFKLLDMTYSEFFQAVLKTIQGTFPKGKDNDHARDLFCYFTNMFFDARDDSLSITLKAHKTVTGQLEKGKLTLDSGWKDWDEVRKNSVLTQTLHNLSSLNTKPKYQTNSRSGNSSKSTGNNSGPSTSTSSGINKNARRPCVVCNTR